MQSNGAKDSGFDLTQNMKEALTDALSSIGRVNIAIFGRTGVGKSTIINAVFGQDAETGIGEPVTRNTHYYEHPNGILGIYDSQGFETGDAGDALLDKMRQLVEEKRSRPISEHIHVLWYCVSATDRRFEQGQADFVRALSALGLPVMLVMTQVEYGLDDKAHPQSVELAQYIEGLGLPLKPSNDVIFTNAVVDPHSRNPTPIHGLNTLLDRTFTVIPDAVRRALAAAQRFDIERKQKESREIAIQMSLAAATAAAVPIPLSDSAMIMPIQVTMMARIAIIWDMQIQAATLCKIAMSAFVAQGIAQIGKAAVTALLSLIPGVNLAAGVIKASVAATLTYAVGEAWTAVCLFLNGKDPHAVALIVDSPELSRIFIKVFKEQVARPLPASVLTNSVANSVV